MIKKPVIAVIDSGINPKVEFYNKVIDGVSFYLEGDSLFMTNDFEDECGHGTYCASIIRRHCPEALLYVIKIIDEREVCESVLLLHALEYLIDKPADIINISLSVGSNVYQNEICSAIKELYYKDKIINVAVKNGCKTSFPAADPYCFGILGASMAEEEYDYDEKSEIQIKSNFLPEWVRGLGERWEWFGGNSKATALMSAVMGKYIGKLNNKGILEDIKMELNKGMRSGISGVKPQYISTKKDYLDKNPTKKLIKNHVCEKAYINSEFINERYIKKMFSKTENILKEYISDENIDLDTEIWVNRCFKINDTYGFLKKIEELLGIKIQMYDICLENFANVRQIIYFLCTKSENMLLRQG